MTTSVTIKTVDWPVRVLEFPISRGRPKCNAEWSEIGEVEPHSERVFYAHSGADILIQELARPETGDGA